MADGASSSAQRRPFRTRPAAGATSGVTVHVAGDQLKSIFVYVDELDGVAKKELKRDQGGTVTLVAESGQKFVAILVKTWFPAGTWFLTMGANGLIDSLECAYPPDMPGSVTDTLREHGRRENVIQWMHRKSDEQAIFKLVRASQGKRIRLVVSYAKSQKGNAKSLPEKFTPTDEHRSVLADEKVATIYLQFVEHFGHVEVDYKLAKDGLTDDEIAKVEKNRPPIIEITNIFTQGYSEFQAVA